MAVQYEEEDSSNALGDETTSNDGSEEAADAIATLLTEAEPVSTSKKRKQNPTDDNTPHSISKRKESQVWRFYDRNVDRSKVCKVCQKPFSVNTATGALRKHLASHFGDQTDNILNSAHSAMEVTISPATNMVTVTSASTDLPATIITATPRGRARRQIMPRPSAPVAPATIVQAMPVGHVKQRYKSAVWEHFIRHEDGRPECLHCNYVYSSNASTSGLKRHWLQHQMEQTGEVQVKTPRAPRASTVTTMTGGTGGTGTGTGGSSLKQPVPSGTLKSAVKSANATTGPLLTEDAFLKLIINEHLPVGDVARQYSAVYRLATGKTPDASTIDTRLKALFTKKKEEIRQYLKRSSSRVSLSVEVWRAADGCQYLLVTAHLLTDGWEQVRFLLDCVLISPDVRADVVKDHLVGMVGDYQCGEMVTAVATADGGGDGGDGSGGGGLVSEAFRLFQQHMAGLGGPEMAHVNCIGSGLGVCVEPALTKAAEEVKKVRRFLKVLLNSRKLSELCQRSHLNLQDYHELKLDTPTVWTSTVVMVDAAVKMRTVIDDLIKQNEGVFQIFTEEDWSVLEHTLELVSNFHLAAQDVGKQDYPSLSVALPLVEFLTTHLTAHKERADTPTWVKPLAEDMLNRTKSLLDTLLTDVYFFGTVLDPRHKLTTIPASVSPHTIRENLRTAFARYLVPGGTTVVPGGGSGTVTEHPLANGGVGTTYKAGSLMSAILKKNQATTVQPQLDELTQYLDTAAEQPDVDPLKWWENYRKVYPNLALMARDYMGVPATAVPSGQLFLKEQSVGKLRNRLDAEEMLMYVCLKSWIEVDFSSGGHMANGVVTLKR